MSIFSRLTDIVHANLNALLERAEDPEKMIRLMIQEMEDTLVEVRSSAVKFIADKKELQRRLDKIEASAGEWQEKAEFALEKGREDLAKGALMARRKLLDQAEALREELVLIEQSLNKSNEDLGRLQAKLDEAKAKKKALEIRMKSAQKRAKMRRTLDDGRIDEAMERYQGLERRIDELEADAEVYDLGQGQNLEQEFAELSAETGVEDELGRLKAKLAAGRKTD